MLSYIDTMDQWIFKGLIRGFRNDPFIINFRALCLKGSPKHDFPTALGPVSRCFVAKKKITSYLQGGNGSDLFFHPLSEISALARS